jgi:hypothetical protein
MVMVGHAQRLAAPLTRWQRRMLAVAGAIVLALGLWALLGGRDAPASSHGCVNVVVASSTGAGMLHECGGSARSLCRSQATADGVFAATVRTQCRLAGLQSRRP